MKKLLIISNIIFCGMFIFGTCKDKLKPLPANCNPCKDYSQYPQFNYLNASMLNTMATMYQPVDVITANKTMVNDATSIWFSLDSIKRFIWEIENTVCKNKCTNNNEISNLGIRIYYARYPQTRGNSNQKFSQLTGLQEDYENRHTIFMIPTYDNKSAQIIEHTDFDPRLTNKDPKTNSCVYSNLDGVIATGAGIIAMAGTSATPLPSAIGSGTTTAQNHGSLCPPLSCKGKAF